MPLSVQSLLSGSGLSALQERLQGAGGYYDEPESAPAIRELLQSELQERPEIEDIQLHARPGIPSGYYPDRDTIQLGVMNPAVVAHELGHAKNLRKAKFYGTLLRTANTIARLNNTAALPAMLAIRALVDDRNTRDEIFNILSGATTAVSAPGLTEEISASVDAVKHAPDKLQALKTLIPAFLQHALHAATPLALYQVGRHW